MRRLLILLTVLAPLPANAINVFACEPEWASLVAELAGEHATLTVATTAMQDPHRLQARPSLIAAMRTADLVVCTGADLEVGWLPLLLRRAGNGAIQPGAPGYFLAADHVRKLEVPQLIDRSQGDVHPQGNPHIHLDARNVRRIADALGARLLQVDPENAADYTRRLEDFASRWSAAVDRWEERALPLAGLRLASSHKSFSYLAAWLDLDIVATLEPKPGIPASGAHLARLLDQLQENPPAAVVRTPYENEKSAEWLSKRLAIPHVVLPYTVGGADDAVDLFALFDASIDALERLAP